MNRYRDPLGEDNLFDRDEAKQREQTRAERLALAKHRAEQEAAQDAILAANGRESMRRANAELLLRDYRRAGVEPLSVDDSGTPRCSLHILLQIGWTIEDMGNGIRQLVAPPPLPARNPDKRESS